MTGDAVHFHAATSAPSPVVQHIPLHGHVETAASVNRNGKSRRCGQTLSLSPIAGFGDDRLWIMEQNLSHRRIPGKIRRQCDDYRRGACSPGPGQ